MNRVTIQEKLQNVFRDVFDDETIEIYDGMTSDDIEDWDSLSHITLISEIEATFGVRFRTDEILKAKNVGEFISILEEKTK